MTKAELNRDIKRLPKIQDEDKKRSEFIRLFNADRKIEYMNMTSLRIMLKMNLRHRYVGLHVFGLEIGLYEEFK